MAMSMTAPIRLAVAERRRLAVELRKQGGTLEEIAEQLRGVEGVSPKYGKDQVQKDIKAELGRLQAQTSEIAEELRQLEVERLDDLWKVYFAKAKKGDYAAADRCFVILDKRAKLMPSLYPPAPPSTLRLTGANDGPIETRDVSLSDDERLARIAALLDAARARRDGQAAEPDQT
jgi:DNA-binding transcriptional MerR regulator